MNELSGHGWRPASGSPSHRGRSRLQRIIDAQNRRPGSDEPRDDRPEAPFVGVNSESPLVYKKRLAEAALEAERKKKMFKDYQWKPGTSGNPKGGSKKMRERKRAKELGLK